MYWPNALEEAARSRRFEDGRKTSTVASQR